MAQQQQDHTDSMTVLQAASLAGVSKQVVHMWVKRGGYRGLRLRTLKYGARTYVSRNDVEHIIAYRNGPTGSLFSDSME